MIDLFYKTTQYMTQRGYTDEQIQMRWGLKNGLDRAIYLSRMRLTELQPTSEWLMDWREDHAQKVKAGLGEAAAGRAASMASGVIRRANRTGRQRS